MPSTWSDLKIELMATGEKNTTWGNISNVNWDAMEEAVSGSTDVTFASADVTLTLVDTNAAQPARNMRLRLVGVTGGTARNLILGAGCQIEKMYLIKNECADAVTVKNTTGTGVAVPPGGAALLYNDGVNVTQAVNFVGSSSGGLTPGSVVFAGPGGVLAQNNAQFFWDNANNALSVGTATALQPFANRGNFSLNGATDAVISFGNGGVLAGYIHSAAASLNFNASGARDMMFNLGAVERMRILGADGKVGIGTNNPFTTLHIKSAAHTQLTIDTATAAGNGQASVSFRDAGGQKGYLGFSSSSNDQMFVMNERSSTILFGTNGSVKATLAADGSFGIGLNLSPLYPLHVKVPNSDAFRIETTGAVGTGSSYMSFADAGGRKAYFGFGSASDALFVMNERASSILLGTNAVTRVVIDANGNTGLGASSPQAKVHIIGPATYATGLANARSLASLWIEGNSGSSWGLATGSTNLGYHYLQGMDRAQVSARDMLLQPFAGQIGVGTDSPTPGYKFQVMNGPIACGGGATNGVFALRRKTDGAGIGSFSVTDDNNINLENTNGGGIVLYINGVAKVRVLADNIFGPAAANTIHCGGASQQWIDVYAVNNVIQTSDQRTKTSLTTLTSAELAAAKTIAQGIGSYRWLDTETLGDHTHVGVVAQAVVAAMEAQGLDALAYGFVRYDEWEAVEEIPAIEAQDAVVDAETGEIIQEAVQGDYGTPGREAGNSYGVVYTELAMFIAAAQEQRLAALEALLP